MACWPLSPTWAGSEEPLRVPASGGSGKQFNCMPATVTKMRATFLPGNSEASGNDAKLGGWSAVGPSGGPSSQPAFMGLATMPGHTLLWHPLLGLPPGLPHPDLAAPHLRPACWPHCSPALFLRQAPPSRYELREVRDRVSLSSAPGAWHGAVAAGSQWAG